MNNYVLHKTRWKILVEQSNSITYPWVEIYYIPFCNQMSSYSHLNKRSIQVLLVSLNHREIEHLSISIWINRIVTMCVYSNAIMCDATYVYYFQQSMCLKLNNR